MGEEGIREYHQKVLKIQDLNDTFSLKIQDLNDTISLKIQDLNDTFSLTIPKRTK